MNIEKYIDENVIKRNQTKCNKIMEWNDLEKWNSMNLDKYICSIVI